MNLEDKLNNILCCGDCSYMNYNRRECEKKRMKQILSLLASELPKEKETPPIGSWVELLPQNTHIISNVGYNQCLSDIKKKWGIDNLLKED